MTGLRALGVQVMRSVPLLPAALLLILVGGCANTDPDLPLASETAPQAPSPSPPDRFPTPEADPTSEASETFKPFEPGSADELPSLAAAAADGVDGDLQAWGRWLGCRAPRVSDALMQCVLPLSDGPTAGVVVDWFAVFAEDDGTVDMSTALLGASVGRGLALSGLCPDDDPSATLVTVSLAPGYEVAFGKDGRSSEERLDAGREVWTAVERKVAATGLETGKMRGVEVLRCSELSTE